MTISQGKSLYAFIWFGSYLVYSTILHFFSLIVLIDIYIYSNRFVVCSHMRSHPMSEKGDHDRMADLEVRMADATNLAGVEKIPQVRKDAWKFGLVTFIVGNYIFLWC